MMGDGVRPLIVRPPSLWGCQRSPSCSPGRHRRWLAQSLAESREAGGAAGSAAPSRWAPIGNGRLAETEGTTPRGIGLPPIFLFFLKAGALLLGIPGHPWSCARRPRGRAGGGDYRATAPRRHRGRPGCNAAADRACGVHRLPAGRPAGRLGRVGRIASPSSSLPSSTDRASGALPSACGGRAWCAARPLGDEVLWFQCGVTSSWEG